MIMIKKVSSLIIIMLMLSLPIVVKATTVQEERTAVLETAKAFYNRGGYVQYDSFRKTAVATPEDATGNHTVYTDCGIFLYQVYSQALGMKIPDSSYNLANYADGNNKHVLVNIKAPSKGGSWDNSNVIQELRNWLNGSFNFETGDIIVYRRYDGTGHVMMVDASDKNNVKIIDSGYTTNGGYYDAVNHVDKVETHSIGMSTLKNKIQAAISYGSSSNSSIKQLSVIRFLSDGDTWINTQGREEKINLTSTAQSRVKYPGLTITKTAEVTNIDASVGLDSAIPNSTILYHLTIKNNGDNTYNNLVVKEEKSANVNFKMTSDGRVSGNTISWTISSLKVGESKTINYSVTVPDDENLLGEYVTMKGQVASIKTATISHILLNALNNQNINTFQSTYNNLKNSNYTETEFISKIYNDAFGYDLSYLNNVDLNNILSMNECSKNGYCLANITNKNIRNITLLNYYGLRVTPYNYKNTSGENTFGENLINANNAWDFYSNDASTRARELTVNDLQIGDIILYKDYSTKAYIYIGNKELVRKTSGGIESINGLNLITFLRNIVGDNYMVLRPAIMMNKTYAQYVDTKKNSSKKGVTSVKKQIDSTADGVEVVYESIENPDCGYAIPAIFLLSLMGMLILVKIKLKPNRLYRLK